MEHVGQVMNQAEEWLGQLHPGLRTALTAALFTASEILMALTCLGGPLALGALCFCSAATVTVSKYMAKRYNWSETTMNDLAWDLVSSGWKIVMKLWHGQEFRGFENIPSDRGALIIWFHGPMPADYFGLIGEIWIRQRRILKTVMDRVLVFMPGSWMFMKNMGCIVPDQDECVAALKQGEVLGIAPGGSRESLYTEGYYTLWNGRVGFAKVALKAEVPIIPVFTQNIQQAYMSMKSGGFLWRQIFERIKMPIIPIWGGFPVKLITHIGEPILPRPDETPEELKERVKNAVEDLIRKHQDSNVGLLDALRQRWAIQTDAATTDIKTHSSNGTATFTV